jgi:hypothetical protein
VLDPSILSSSERSRYASLTSMPPNFAAGTFIANFSLPSGAIGSLTDGMFNVPHEGPR